MPKSDATPTSPEVYTVYARETPFRLTRSQIEFDAPNYFTAAFLSQHFAESATREIRTDKHPQLFALIVEHLSGYTFSPLRESSVPRHMSLEAAHENLLRDAKYFGLDQLESLLSVDKVPPALPDTVSALFFGTTVIPLDRVLEGGDLTLDTKANRPFVSGQPLALEGDTSRPLFLVRDALMYFDLDPVDPDVQLAQTRLSLTPGSQTLDRARHLQGARGRCSLRWDYLGQRNVHSQSTPVFKLDGTTVAIDHLEQAFVAAERDSDRGRPAFVEVEAFKAPCRVTSSGGRPRLEVVAETLVVSIDGNTQSEGYYREARASFVYAELRTIEKWTKTRLGPAIAASIERFAEY